MALFGQVSHLEYIRAEIDTMRIDVKLIFGHCLFLRALAGRSEAYDEGVVHDELRPPIQ